MTITGPCPEKSPRIVQSEQFELTERLSWSANLRLFRRHSMPTITTYYSSYLLFPFNFPSKQRYQTDFRQISCISQKIVVPLHRESSTYLESVCLCACEGQIFEKNKEKFAYLKKMQYLCSRKGVLGMPDIDQASVYDRTFAWQSHAEWGPKTILIFGESGAHPSIYC